MVNNNFKSVMRSIKPFWFYLICEVIKTIEVSKTAPTAKDWDKITYLYCSKDMKSFNSIPKEHRERYRKYLGKVGARFVCEKVTKYSFSNLEAEYRITDVDISNTCLNHTELISYGKGEILFGWHISELKIYDEPRELYDFVNYKKYKVCKEKDCFSSDCFICPNNSIVCRPPQSWFYVNELI